MEYIFELAVELPPKGSGEAADSLYQQIKSAIDDGRLRAGAKLPATRNSHKAFGVSRNTVVEIYDRLLNEGLVVSRHGSGTYVAERSRRFAAADADQLAPDPRLNAFWLGETAQSGMRFWRDTPSANARGPKPIDFRPALVDSSLFPFDVLRQVTAKQLRGLENKPASFKSPQGNQGNYFLRDAIADHVSLTRAVACNADDVVVVSGAQQGFDLAARILVTPGKTVVAIEDPGYPPMRVAFAAAGARLAPVGVDGEGLIVEDLPEDANVICLCPSHQFPTGASMSANRRRDLIAFARARNAIVIEDDYDGEFRFDGGPLEALHDKETADVVFYVGTFSKCMLPSLRIGFVIPPRWAMPALVAAKNCTDWHCSTLLQRSVAGFIRDGHLARHVRRMRHIYKGRREVLQAILDQEFAGVLERIPAYYGMHLSATAVGEVDLEAASALALQHNIRVHTFDRYFLGNPARTGLVFGYGGVDLADMTRGLEVLRDSLRCV